MAGAATGAAVITGVALGFMTPLSYFQAKSYTPGLSYVQTQYVNYYCLMAVILVGVPPTVWWLRRLRGGKELVRATVLVYLGLALTNLVVNLLKWAVGKERPDYQDRLRHFPSGHNFVEARRSFPSGHTAMAAGAAVFLVHAGVVRAKQAKPPASRQLLLGVAIAVPALLAALVGASRIIDHRHDIIDVATGALIAIAVCSATIRGERPQSQSRGLSVE